MHGGTGDGLVPSPLLTLVSIFAVQNWSWELLVPVRCQCCTPPHNVAHCVNPNPLRMKCSVCLLQVPSAACSRGQAGITQTSAGCRDQDQKYSGEHSVADLGGYKCTPLWWLVIYFCLHNCTSPSNDYAAVACSNNQAQLHTHVSVLY